MKKTYVDIVIVAGHKKSSTGAYNKELNEREFNNNNKEAFELKSLLRNMGIKSKIIHRDDKKNKYKKLPKIINKLKPKFVLSLHHNSYNKKSTGTETLYYYKCKTSKKIAEIVQSMVVKALGYTDRGIKGKSTEERGGFILRYVNAPMVLLEPCFMSNTAELRDFIENKQSLYVRGLANAIKEILDKDII